jgi:nitrite reductase/ring-hydroxylating ferredoxin subunit
MPDRQVEKAADATRRAVIAGAGLLGASTLLTGCSWDTSELRKNYGGGDDTQTTAPAAPAAQGNGGAAATTGTAQSGGDTGGTELTTTSAIPVGGGKVFAGAKVVVTQPVAGTFKAFTNICTHAQCSVNQVANGTINCPCHGAKFSVEDGSVKGGPAPTGLQEVAITVDGDSIKMT